MEHRYYKGGIAEFVAHPSPLTFSFLEHWFTSNKSFGRGLDHLSIPHTKNDKKLLVMNNNELFVDIEVEEEVLYKNTILSYSTASLHSAPKTKINLKKILSLHALRNTARLLLLQSSWISNPQKTIENAQKIAETIPTIFSKNTIAHLDKIIAQDVLPNLIAVGYITQYFSALSKEVTPPDKNDWFIHSYKDQILVQNSTMTFSEFIKIYGLRADDDYELSEPRWYEIKDEIKKRIKNYSSPHTQSKVVPLNKNQEITQKLESIRSDAKKRALHSFYELRYAIIKKTGTNNIVNYTREELLGEKTHSQKQRKIPNFKREKDTASSKNGIPISKGTAKGKVYIVQKNTDKIPPNSIAIFPNASPYYANQYPTCKGMIFLSGGITSHGSIVAREYQIPALISPNATNLTEEKNIRIDGAQGIWEIVSQ